MMLEKHLSLNEGARLIGISPHTLKRWLRLDLGILVPRVRNGSRVMIRERDIQRVIELRRDARTAT